MKRIVSIILSFIMMVTLSIALSTDAYAGVFFKKVSTPKIKITHMIHLPKIVEVKPASCTIGGYVKSKCIICGKYTYKYINSTGHKFDSGNVTKEPTCYEDGIRTFSCTKCNAKEDCTIAKLNHTPVIDKAVEPTCAEYGLTEGSHCEVCGEIIVPQDETYILDCNIIEELVPATLTSDGYYRYYCTNCDYDETKIISRPYNIKLSLDNKSFTTEFDYTGEAIKPKVKVIDKNGKEISKSNYTVKFSNNTEIGTADVLVSFYGEEYDCEMSTTFTIKEPDVSESENINTLAIPSIIKAQSGTGKNSIMLYHTTANTKLYDIEYSTSSSFSGATIVRVKTNDNGSFCTSEITVNVAASQGQMNKAYFVRVRGVDESTGAVTPWSTANSVTITIIGSSYIY